MIDDLFRSFDKQVGLDGAAEMLMTIEQRRRYLVHCSDNYHGLWIPFHSDLTFCGVHLGAVDA